MKHNGNENPGTPRASLEIGVKFTSEVASWDRINLVHEAGVEEEQRQLVLEQDLVSC